MWIAVYPKPIVVGGGVLGEQIISLIIGYHGKKDSSDGKASKKNSKLIF